MYEAIITPKQLQELLRTNENILLFDCHHDLRNPEAGRRKWQQERIAQAGFLHLDEDLSGPIIPGQTGRHPLPSNEKFLGVVSSKGFVPDIQQQVIVYDSKLGGIAARAWWMFKWIGHEKVAVLEGGYPAWKTELKEQGLSTDQEEKIEDSIPVRRRTQPLQSVSADERPVSTSFATLKPKKGTLAEAHSRMEIERIRQSEYHTLIDSRTEERYRGEYEPIDPVAGHIEGAVNLPWPENLDKNGRFKSIAELKSRFAPLKEQAAKNVFYCGSGVTACHNILAYHHAFGEMPGLYAGSWSEWIQS